MSQRYARVAFVGLALFVVAGCASTPRAAQVPPPMPAAPAEIQTAQPATGYIWIPGRYEWRANERTYVWVPGHWTVPPPGYTWVPGHWEVRPDGSVWVESRWQRS